MQSGTIAVKETFYTVIIRLITLIWVVTWKDLYAAYDTSLST